MGLYIVSGTMGGGKSYFAASLAYDCWRNGGVVHSNMPWHYDVLEERGFLEKHVILPSSHEKWVRTEIDENGEERVASDILIGGHEGQENLIIIDEASLGLSAMDQAESKKKNKTLFRLVVMSRQLGLDMYFISQATTNLDVYIRNVSENIIHCQNVSRIPGLGAILAYCVGTFRRTWLSPQQRKALQTKYARFNSAIGALYNTHGEGDKMNIKRTEKLRKKKGTGIKVKHVLFISVALGLLYYGISTFVGPSSTGLPGFSPIAVGVVPLKTSAGAHGSTSVPDHTKDISKSGVLRIAMRKLDNSVVIDSQGTRYEMQPSSGAKRIVSVQDDGSVLTLQLIGGREVELNYE